MDTSELPNVPLLRLLRKDDHPHHIKPPARLPQNTHPGNDGSSQPTFTLAKSIRAYEPTTPHVAHFLIWSMIRSLRIGKVDRGSACGREAEVSGRPLFT
jgi:hypothetical protein